MVCKRCGIKMEYGNDSSPGGPYGDETILSYFYACHKCKYHMESRENIGGGFGVAIHNIQEAVTFGKPVIFGPKYTKFKEAVELKQLGGAYSIKTSEEFELIATKLLIDEELYENASKVCADYISRNIGATKLIMAQLKNKL